MQLQIDTGQILPPEIFIKEYAAGSGLTTPLANTFYFREQELENIKGNLATGEIVVLTGPAGVGKSKLALTAIDNWKKEQKNYEVYWISNKYVEIFEDIKSYLKSGRNLCQETTLGCKFSGNIKTRICKSDSYRYPFIYLPGQ